MTTGLAVVEVHPSWSPIGAQRFHDLIQAGFFSRNSFFRVVPDFVAQWGISSDPTVTAAWAQCASLPNDATQQPPAVSNLAGTLAFAAEYVNGTACCRTTQLFVNYANNSQLDASGFTPFARVVSGWDGFLGINSEYGQEPVQSRIEQEGARYLEANFPNLSYLKSVTLKDHSGDDRASMGWKAVLVVLAVLAAMSFGIVCFVARQRQQKRMHAKLEDIEEIKEISSAFTIGDDTDSEAAELMMHQHE